MCATALGPFLNYFFHAWVKYDHQIFPGAVPRTFVGSVLLAWLTNPILYLVGTRQDNLNGTKFDIQILGPLSSSVQLTTSSENKISSSGTR